MESFQTISSEKVKLAANSDLLPEGITESPLEIFNRYVHLVNQSIKTPLTQRELHQEALDAQIAFNKAFEKSKRKWKNTEAKDDLVLSIPRELAGLQRRFNELQQNLEEYKKKQIFIANTVKDTPNTDHLGKDEFTFDWNYMINNYLQDNQTWVKNAKNLKKAWQLQGALVTHNLKDLYALKKEFKDFGAFLTIFCEKLSKSRDPAAKEMQKAIKHNLVVLAKYNERMHAAIKWRLQAGVQKKLFCEEHGDTTVCREKQDKNLFCDDQMYVLQNYLSLHVVQNDADAVADFKQLFAKINKKISYSATFKLLLKAYKMLRQSEDTDWLQRYWAHYTKFSKLIPSAAQEGFLIPKALLDWVPEKPGYTVGSWLRYYYFRTQESTHGLWDNFKQWLLGRYNETLVFINETHESVKSFASLLKAAKDDNQMLNMDELDNIRAFRQALELPKIIHEELVRTKELRPSYFLGYLISWVPFVNRYASYQFFLTWQNLIVDSERKIRKFCQELVSSMLPDLEVMILQSIRNNKFNCSPELYQDIKKFIWYYGNESDQQRLAGIIKPINILKKLDFLIDSKDGGKPQLNMNRVEAITRFAKKYWTQEQFSAVSLLVSIVSNEYLPISTQQQEASKKILAPICPSDLDVDIFYQKMMQWIAEEIIFPQGDPGLKSVYDFMQIYAPKVAQNWKNIRDANAKDKFAFVRYLIGVKPLEEKNLRSTENYVSGDSRFVFNEYERIVRDLILLNHEKDSLYLPKLMQALDKYVSEYSGQTTIYHNLVYLISEGEGKAVNEYYKKRLTYLIRNNDMNTASLDDYNFLGKMTFKHNNIQVFKDLINQYYTGDNQDLADFILKVDMPELTGTYFAKRLFFMATNGMRLSDKDIKFYSILKENKYFRACLNQCFCDFIQECVDNQDVQIYNDNLFFIVKKFANVYTQDTLGIIRIEHLLDQGSFEEISKFIKLLAKLKLDLHKDFVQTKEGAQYLAKKYIDAFSENLKNPRWSAHAQYIYQFFDAPYRFMNSVDQRETVGMHFLRKARLLWLYDFCNQKGAYSEDAELDHIYENVGSDNASAPTVNQTLAYMYGYDNLHKVSHILHKRLNRFNPRLDSKILELMDKYLHHSDLLRDNDEPLLRGKFKFYQQLCKIFTLVESGSFDDAIKAFEHLYASHKSYEDLANDGKTDWQDDLVEYQEKLLTAFYFNLLECYKAQIYNLHRVENQVDAMRKITECESVITAIFEQGQQNDILEQVDFIHKKVFEIFLSIKKITQAGKNSPNKFEPSFDDAILIRSMVDVRHRKDLCDYILKKSKKFSEQDPIHAAYHAFVYIIDPAQDDKQQGELSDQKEILSKFKQFDTEHESKATDIVSQITLKLEKGEPFTLLDFGETPQRYIIKAIKSIASADEYNKIGKALSNRISQILNDRTPQINRKMSSHIETIAQLLDCLNKDKRPSKSIPGMDIIISVNKLFINSVSAFVGILCADNDCNFNRMLIQYKFALVTKNKALISQLAKQMQSVEQKLTNLIMQGNDDEQMHTLLQSVKNAFDFLNLQQKQRFYQNLENTIKRNSVFDGTNNRREVRKCLFKEHLPSFLDEVDAQVLVYFANHYHLQPDGLSKILQHYVNAKIFPNDSVDDIKAKISAKTIVKTLNEAGAYTGLFRQYPDERDAQKILNYFCFKAKIYWIKETLKKDLYDRDVQAMLNSLNENHKSINKLFKSVLKDKTMGSGSYKDAVESALDLNRNYFAWPKPVSTHAWYRRRDSNSHVVTNTGF